WQRGPFKLWSGPGVFPSERRIPDECIQGPDGARCALALGRNGCRATGVGGDAPPHASPSSLPEQEAQEALQAPPHRQASCEAFLSGRTPASIRLSATEDGDLAAGCW